MVRWPWRKGELLAVEVEGDLQSRLQQQRHRGRVGVLHVTRSVINAASLSGILAKKGTRRAVRVRRQARGEGERGGRLQRGVPPRRTRRIAVVGVAMVTDDFGGGGGLTLRYVKHRMATWKGETVGGSEI